jgi:hypothetical protein
VVTAGPGRLHPETAVLMPMCVKSGTSPVPPCQCMRLPFSKRSMETD